MTDYRPDERRVQSVLDAFARLGGEITALQQDAQRQRQFVTRYAHELTAALSDAQRMRMYVEELEKQLRAVDDADDATRRMGIAADRAAARWAEMQEGGGA